MAAALAALGLLAGCAGAGSDRSAPSATTAPVPGTGPGSALETFHRAVDATTRRATMRVRSSLQVTARGDGGDQDPTGCAGYPPGAGPDPTDLAVDLPRQVIEVVGGAGTALAVGTPEAAYLAGRALPEGVDAGRPWAMIPGRPTDRVKPGPRSPFDVAVELSSLRNLIPLPLFVLIDQIPPHTTGADDAGTEHLEGIDLHHLRLSVDATDVAASRPDLQKAATGDAWVDSEGMLRRLDLRVQIHGGASSPIGAFETTFEYHNEMSGYGAPLPADVPRPDEAIDVRTLPGRLLAPPPNTATCTGSGARIRPGEPTEQQQAANEACVRQAFLAAVAGHTVDDTVTGGYLRRVQRDSGCGPSMLDLVNPEPVQPPTASPRSGPT